MDIRFSDVCDILIKKCAVCLYGSEYKKQYLKNRQIKRNTVYYSRRKLRGSDMIETSGASA